MASVRELASLADRNAIAPMMAEYDRVGRQWLPYIMTFHSASVRFPSVSTDEYGFRTTVAADGRSPVTLARFRDGPDAMSRGAVLGGSTAFGVGALSDAGTVASVLNATTDSLWFNYGGRTFNSTQEALVFLLFFPRRLDRLVVLSGVNNLILAYLASRTSPVYNSLFLQSMFERAMDYPPDTVIGVRKAARRLLAELRYKIAPPAAPTRQKSVVDQYADILEAFRRDLLVVKAAATALGSSVAFAMQPLATWIDKQLSDEERRLFAVLDRMPGDWEVLATHLAQHRRRYAADVQRVCEELGIPFIDLSEDPAFVGPEWLFVDRVHLTDRGYAHAAACMKRAFGL